MRFIKDRLLKLGSLEKNSLLNLLFRTVNIVCSLLSLRLLFQIIGSESVGFWITITTFVSWVGFFNLGLGNGLRNLLVSKIEEGDKEGQRYLISTTYILSLLILGSLTLLGYGVLSYIDLSAVLVTPDALKNGISVEMMVFAVLGFSCLRIILGLINNVLQAHQTYAQSGISDAATNVIFLLFLLSLKAGIAASFDTLLIAFLGIPALVLLLITVYLFFTRYKAIRPSFAYFKKSLARPLFSLGIGFFLIQISALVLYQTNVLIIQNYLGNQEVSEYGVAHRYFNLLLMLFTILLGPYWSAFTKAQVSKDYSWISATFKKLQYLLLAMVGIGAVMFWLSPWAMSFLSDGNEIPSRITSLLMLSWILVLCFNSLFSHLLNGLSQVALQVKTALVAAILNLILVLSLVKPMGVNGMILGNIVANGFSGIVYLFWYAKFRRNLA
ncbi:hypothetical protein [Roseivirga thermotolerans]|uniref:hypothetical protein n=1 Tax=Roseivirga thermotolerans TaxID=1758176 RepID=UPI00273F3875|nr:hypothetical protein [Roseivirga thermotolerans]